MDKVLNELMNSKISQLERYNELTLKIIYDDIDEVENILDERQDLITTIDGISLEIKQIVSEQSIERREMLDKMFEDKENTAEYPDFAVLQTQIKRAAELTDSIIKNDKRAFNRIKRERDEAKEHLENAAKGKQVADYFSSSSAADVTKGSKLNVSN